MNPDTLAHLEARLRKLEKQNRLLITALALGVSLIACTSASLSSRDTVEELRAKRFVLVDAKGNQLGEWTSSSSQGMPAFTLGRPSAPFYNVTQTAKGSLVTLFSKAGAQGYWRMDDVSAGFSLYGGDQNGKRGHISLTTTSQPTVIVENGADSRLHLEPDNISYRRAGAKKDQWGFRSDAFFLNGISLKLNAADGKPIQQLP